MSPYKELNLNLTPKQQALKDGCIALRRKCCDPPQSPWIG